MGCAGSISVSVGPRKRSFHASYRLGSKLGSGAFGQVRLAHKKDTLAEVAVKIIALEGESGLVDHELLRTSQNEAKLASRVGDHPNCVQVIEYMQEKHLYYLVMERCQSSLLDMMKSSFFLIEHDLPRILSEMLTGIAHCHSLRIVHRDVKPENFMFGGPEGMTLKLCDFGLAQALPEAGYMTGVCGTAPYMAPEILRVQAYNEKVDVWSLGAVAYLLLFGRFPYMPKVIDSDAIKAMIRLGDPEPFFATDERGAFTRLLLERSKNQRCSAREALNSTYLKSQMTSTQETWASEVESAALLASAAEKNVSVGVDSIAQHRLDDLLDRLQDKHARLPTKESVSSAPSFFHFSEAPESCGRSDSKSAEVEPRIRSTSCRLKTQLKTHTGILYVVPERLANEVSPCMSEGSTADPSVDNMGLPHTLVAGTTMSSFAGDADDFDSQVSGTRRA
eukprot:TRINITY_DN16880_c0_g2_i1.p1 TRINITY_DN16880_c0_g2~~TRINITY_DN16880_c0_g2_i1.p1  ORF type:complete len:449 (-),score=55.90 TRINITY_DN16880_c0_g2_i1:368-1714(-)